MSSMTDEQMIAAQKATIAKLTTENYKFKNALLALAKLGNEPYYGNSTGNCIAQEALGIDPTK